MALIDQYNESQVLLFQQKVLTAMLAAAINIQAETSNTFVNTDAAAAATSLVVVNGAVYSVNDLISIGVGLGTVETRKVTAISSNTLTVTALTNAHKAGELTQKVLYNHANRIALAKAVLNSPNTYMPLFAQAICANDSNLTIANDGTISDSTINTDVSACWNAIAGTL